MVMLKILDGDYCPVLSTGDEYATGTIARL
jgi:hypothetical protein